MNREQEIKKLDDYADFYLRLSEKYKNMSGAAYEKYVECLVKKYKLENEL